MLAELERLDADVLAVQEMDQFEEFWAVARAARMRGRLQTANAGHGGEKGRVRPVLQDWQLELLARQGLEYNDEAFAGEPSVETTSGNERRRRREESGRRAGDAKSLLALRTFRARDDDSETVSKLPETRKTHVRDGVGILACSGRNARRGPASDEDDAEGDEKRKPFLVASTHCSGTPTTPT